jgi:hypothetical protein
MLVFKQEIGATVPLPVLRLGRDVCSNLAAAEASEWLVTNGIGGYASGTVSGSRPEAITGCLWRPWTLRWAGLSCWRRFSRS